MSRFLSAFIALVLASAVAAADFQLKALGIKGPFARATPPGAKTAGAFMTIENQGDNADLLVSASSPLAGAVEIHEMRMDGEMMRMREIRDLEIKPGATVALRPGGRHLMLLDLKQPLKQGDVVPLTLRFEKAGSVEIRVSVESMGAGHIQ
jgi:periplasmic copper chaperone A